MTTGNLVENWTSKPKVAGSIPTVVRLIFQLAWCGIYTQSNNTLYIVHAYFDTAKQFMDGSLYCNW